MLDQLLYWHWLILGLLLLICELFAPGAILLCPGIAALITGTLLFLVPGLSLAMQLIIFAALALTSAIIWHFVLKKKRLLNEDEDVNSKSRGDLLVGQRVEVVKPISIDSYGMIKAEDSLWRAEGCDAAAGSWVIITDHSNGIFQVKVAN